MSSDVVTVREQDALLDVLAVMHCSPEQMQALALAVGAAQKHELGQGVP